MKMGIKEFRERITEITELGEPVIVTNHGREIATYLPWRKKDPARICEAGNTLRAWQEEMKAEGLDLDALLAKLGLDPDGVPLDEAGR